VVVVIVVLQWGHDSCAGVQSLPQLFQLECVRWQCTKCRAKQPEAVTGYGDVALVVCRRDVARPTPTPVLGRSTVTVDSSKALSKRRADAVPASSAEEEAPQARPSGGLLRQRRCGVGCFPTPLLHTRID
jgi:hypothetical protein